ncbi:DUF2336 domain-containing protein [Pseudorhizobium flavum]|nr:DUF2336 domain-containing protein [Pseudorhizobium flavum]
MIIQAFLRWLETAAACDRARAANALARAYLASRLQSDQQHAALLAMSHLLDDPAPQVRLGLARALATNPGAPRPIILALAEDQPEIACTVIAQSPVFQDADLVDLVGRGDGLTRGLIATRSGLSRVVSAALVEVGEVGEIVLLLENADAALSRGCLARIADRFGHDGEVRKLLLDRADLAPEVRQRLVSKVGEALAESSLVSNLLAGSRLERLTLEATETATLAIAGSASRFELPALVEHMRSSGTLTPALLINALCTGKADFLSEAMAALSGLDEPRVRALLASGRAPAVRAMFQAGGLHRDVAAVFVAGALLWRQAGIMETSADICEALLSECRQLGARSPVVADLLEIVDRLQRSELRAAARSYAQQTALAA